MVVRLLKYGRKKEGENRALGKRVCQRRTHGCGNGETKVREKQLRGEEVLLVLARSPISRNSYQEMEMTDKGWRRADGGTFLILH